MIEPVVKVSIEGDSLIFQKGDLQITFNKSDAKSIRNYFLREAAAMIDAEWVVNGSTDAKGSQRVA